MKQKSWKEVYEKCNHNRYCQIINVLQKYSISSNIKNFFKNYGLIFTICILILLAFLTFIFRTNLIIVLYSMILCFFLFATTVFYSTYKISLKEDKLVARINLQDINITYKELNNIYLEHQKMKVFFIPIYTYSLKVSYFIDEERINILSFPVIMLNKKDVLGLFNSFEVKAYKDQEKELEREKIDRKNFHKAIGIVIGIIIIILCVVSLILSFI